MRTSKQKNTHFPKYTAQTKSGQDFERIALKHTFSKLLSEHQRDIVLQSIEARFSSKQNFIVPMTRPEILNVLEGLFGTGAYMLINEFDRKMNELNAQGISIA